MEIRERIAAFMEAEQLTRNDFAIQIGVQRSNITHILDGRNRPSLDFIEKMLTKYPKINSEWLILGQGSMFKMATMNSLFPPNNETPENPPVLSNLPLTDKKQDKLVSKIVIFYSDKTFESYIPNE